jgi:hypothetical protein
LKSIRRLYSFLSGYTPPTDHLIVPCCTIEMHFLAMMELVCSRRRSGILRILNEHRLWHFEVVNWKSIRLELTHSSAFPRGSASRSYLLRLPLQDCGSIDEKAFLANPERATVRRFWPSEPDLTGRIVRLKDGWGLRFQDDHECLHTLGSYPLLNGLPTTVADSHGQVLSFKAIIAPPNRGPS